MADTVKMRLTFPRGKQMPGDVIDIPADEVHRWKGFGELAETAPKAAPAPKAPTTGSEPAKAAGK
jgi:hypothetical protein